MHMKVLEKQVVFTIFTYKIGVLGHFFFFYHMLLCMLQAESDHLEVFVRCEIMILYVCNNFYT